MCIKQPLRFWPLPVCPAQPHSPLLPPRPPPAVLGKSSRRLLAFAVQRKWVAATRTLLASVAADQPPEEAMAAVDIMCVGTTGMPLLQLAVRSQRLELVQAVLEWGDANGEGGWFDRAPLPEPLVWPAGDPLSSV